MLEIGLTASHRLLSAPHPLANRRAIRLFRAEPLRPPPAAGHAMLYLLDGNAAFRALSPDHLARVPDLAICGVGYDTDEDFAVAERWCDYTPPLGPGSPAPDPYRPDRLAGGAARFLDLLTGPLRDQAEAGLAVDPARRGLWGHSFGGLFTLFALFARPGAFARHVAVSPSLWWGDGVMERLERLAQFPLVPALSLLVMLGDCEVRRDRPDINGSGPAPATMAMIERLRGRPGLAMAGMVLHGLGHGATLAASLPMALAHAGAGRGNAPP